MDSEHILISGTPEVLRGRVRVVRGQEQAASFVGNLRELAGQGFPPGYIGAGRKRNSGINDAGGYQNRKRNKP